VSSNPSWLWTSASARRRLAGRDVGEIFAAYRTAHHLTQQQLGDRLGFDQSYVCRIENGRRTVRDIPTLNRIAAQLGIPPRLLGLTTATDADFEAMCLFAESSLRLANLVRRAGRPMEAVCELWPLVARLESRSTAPPADPDVLILLAEGCLALGTALGDILPEEELHFSTRWTRRALDLASELGDSALRFHALNLHGNELRKSGRHVDATVLFAEALTDDGSTELHGDTLVLLARARGEMGDARGFDQAIHGASSLLGAQSEASVLLNPFSVREAHIRGLLCTGRESEALLLVNTTSVTVKDHRAVSPQLQVMERITLGAVLAAGGDVDAACEVLGAAVGDGEAYSLPHQVQRAIRAAESMTTKAAERVTAQGLTALGHLHDVAVLPPPLVSAAGTAHQQGRG
jgi:transcriptional regulator with XRE-family HTH domain